MDKPSEVPTWATDDNYSAPGTGFDGTPTKVNPGAGQKAAGFAPSHRPPVRIWNWLFNRVGQWLSFLDGHLGEDSSGAGIDGALNVTTGLEVDENSIFQKEVTIGQNLTVAGAFQAGTGYTLSDIQVFTADGTWTRPPFVRAVRVTVVGGGGGGGGTTGTGSSTFGAGGGGGGGGAAVKWITAPGSSEAVTVGTGGSGSSGSGGADGGDSSFGAHCSASGGGGGSQMDTTSGQSITGGGLSGAGSDGDFNPQGAPGGRAAVLLGTGGGIHVGAGGGSMMGPTIMGRHTATGSTDGPSADADHYGSGGAGAYANNSNQSGGSGASGIVIVEEYV